MKKRSLQWISLQKCGNPLQSDTWRIIPEASILSRASCEKSLEQTFPISTLSSTMATVAPPDHLAFPSVLLVWLTKYVSAKGMSLACEISATTFPPRSITAINFLQEPSRTIDRDPKVCFFDLLCVWIECEGLENKNAPIFFKGFLHVCKVIIQVSTRGELPSPSNYLMILISENMPLSPSSMLCMGLNWTPWRAPHM